jgi:hypothetical protein
MCLVNVYEANDELQTSCQAEFYGGAKLFSCNSCIGHVSFSAFRSCRKERMAQRHAERTLACMFASVIPFLSAAATY